MAYILVLLVNSVWGGMAVEFRNALLQVRQDIEDGRLDAAVERLDRLRGLVARDRWIDDTVLQKSHALIRFTSMPYDQIARAFSAATGCRIPPDAILSVRLMVDRTGFAMQPHTDGGNGALVTFQTYFPAPGLPSDMGTEFFEKRGEAFELRLKRPYLPNHGHVFAVSDDSWHGVRTATPDTLEGRGSLVVRYFRKG